MVKTEYVNPELPADYNNPTEEDKVKVYKWNDFTIDSQVHIYNETPTPEYEALLEQLTEWFHDLDEYKSNQEHFDVFYTREQLFRFLRARSFKLDDAKEMVKQNMQWRINEEPHNIRFAGEMQFHASTGKTHLRHNMRDKYGRPVIVLHNKYNNSNKFEDGARLTFYTLEASSRLLNHNVNGPSRHVVFMNLEGFSYSSQPPMAIAKKVGGALVTGYPERMGLCILYASPFLFRAFYSTIGAMILDDRTKSKIVFIPEGDKQLAEKMEFLLGPNWPQLTGIGQEQTDPAISPGFDAEGYAEHCLSDDERRFGNRLTAEEAQAAAKRLDHDREEAELESIHISGPMIEIKGENNPIEEKKVDEKKAEEKKAEEKKVEQVAGAEEDKKPE